MAHSNPFFLFVPRPKMEADTTISALSDSIAQPPNFNNGYVPAHLERHILSPSDLSPLAPAFSILAPAVMPSGAYVAQRSRAVSAPAAPVAHMMGARYAKTGDDDFDDAGIDPDDDEDVSVRERSESQPNILPPNDRFESKLICCHCWR